MFDKKGVFIPVKNYECIIDTRSSQPIAVKKILYSERVKKYAHRYLYLTF